MGRQQQRKTSSSAIIWAVCVLLLGIATVYVLSSSKPTSNETAPTATTETTDAKKFAAEYKEVGEDNRFVYATAEEVVQKFESGDGMVFLGFPECPWCQQLTPIVDEAAKAENLDKVYYLNIRKARSENDATYQALVQKLATYLPKDENGQPRISVPDVTTLRDGVVVGHFTQEEAEGPVTPTTYWTPERRQRAVVQLREMIVKITDTKVESE